ncbi:hypothetical protein [Rodentibacter caecimuris]|uniref:hypothetical protein n=1 Tax=Rodentibacter caecimuris TaxID=1796644 RepID=UPI0013A090CE|nr:hypothetical protein [Rodentibacter heylii]QIA77221.1 hypothetical protein FEE42_07550 [Rodentibacter heylii]
MKFNNTAQAIQYFEKYSDIHGKATLEGNYKLANSSYKKIVSAKNYLLSINEIDSLAVLLHNKSTSVVNWAASYLLFSKNFSKISQEKLAEIANTSDIFGLDAETILSEWKLGNLSLKE